MAASGQDVVIVTGGSRGIGAAIALRAARAGYAVVVNAGWPGTWVHYAASRGAVDVLTVGLAAEVAAQGIRVNCVGPREHQHRAARRRRAGWSG